MRRLIAWLYATFLGLQVKTHDQHIADLEQLLEELYQAAQHIDAQIEIATDRVLQAHVRRDAAVKRFEQVDTGTSMVDRTFPNPAPRSY
jgi:hypothetical protein